MQKHAFGLFFFINLIFYGLNLQAEEQDNNAIQTPTASTETASAIFAGGCFWCIEADFEKLAGVIDVISGYTGGQAHTADYKTVSRTETGHFEAVKVTYDTSAISYAELVEYFWRHIDPSDADGQFCDKGSSYRSAIFYQHETQHSIILKSLQRLEKNKPFADAIVTSILPAKAFYRAEEYHQDYAKKNPLRYNYYRLGCRRDSRIKQLWGK